VVRRWEPQARRVRIWQRACSMLWFFGGVDRDGMWGWARRLTRRALARSTNFASKSKGTRRLMDTLFADSLDGKRVAYSCSGTGPAIVLLHGGGGSRQEWREAGYVRRLQDNYTVITLDLRGHGDSSLPTDPADYTIDKMKQDILAVVDACGVRQFAIWGMSYGGKVGRYLAVQSERVTKLVLIGTPLGPGVTGERRQQAVDFCEHWMPIFQAQREGSLNPQRLSQEDREFLKGFDVPVMLGWVRAMLEWGTVEPTDFRCPTLWLIGSEDRYAMASVKEYEEALKGSTVQIRIMEGLTHEQVFDEMDRVLPIMLAFTRAQEIFSPQAR
jgi:pimeloyl-ACP methyl ester carboxylesterase